MHSDQCSTDMTALHEAVTDPASDHEDTSLHSRLDRVEAAIEAILVKLTASEQTQATIADAVGPQARRARARREAAILTAAVASGGCLGVGALDLAGASDVTVGLVAGLVALAVASVAMIAGHATLKATVAGASIQTGHAQDTSNGD